MNFPRMWTLTRGVPFAREYHFISLCGDNYVQQKSCSVDESVERYEQHFESYDLAMDEAQRLYKELRSQGWGEAPGAVLWTPIVGS